MQLYCNDVSYYLNFVTSSIVLMQLICCFQKDFATNVSELYCEVIGTIKSVTWQHRDNNLQIGEKITF